MGEKGGTRKFAKREKPPGLRMKRKLKKKVGRGPGKMPPKDCISEKMSV